jgi:3-oxoadipate enol-lactonase
MPAKKVRDTELEYFLEGRGAPLLLLMGIGGDATSWGEPFLDVLRPYFQLVRISNRGSGLSTDPGGELTMRVMADDAVALLEALEIDKAHVLGISMGGRVAQELAVNHPQRVSGLVLGASGCGAPHEAPREPEVAARFTRVLSLDGEDLVREFLLMLVSESFVKDERRFRAVLNQLSQRPIRGESLVRHMEAIYRFDSYERLPQIGAPTLILHGTADTMVPVENAWILGDRIAGSSVELIRGAGHCFFWEKPVESAKAIVTFLEGLSWGRPPRQPWVA